MLESNLLKSRVVQRLAVGGTRCLTAMVGRESAQASFCPADLSGTVLSNRPVRLGSFFDFEETWEKTSGLSSRPTKFIVTGA